MTRVISRVQVNNENGNPSMLYGGGDKIMLAVSMYHMHIELFPVLVPGVAVLIVHLDPQHGFCHPCDLEIRIPIEKLAYKHVSYAYLKK